MEILTWILLVLCSLALDFWRLKGGSIPTKYSCHLKMKVDLNSWFYSTSFDIFCSHFFVCFVKSFSQFSALNLERMFSIDGNIRYQQSTFTYLLKNPRTLWLTLYIHSNTVKHLIWFVIFKTPPKYLQFS